MKYCWNIICFVLGIIVTVITMTLHKWQWDYEVNIISLLSVFVTAILAIIVLYLSKKIEKKDIIRDLIVSDIKDLCKLFSSSSEILNKFEQKNTDLITMQKEIRLMFHRAELIIDRVNKELEESFTMYYKSNKDLILVITSPYYKWLTGEQLYCDNFTMTEGFMKEHETRLYKVISDLRVSIHKFVKSA